MTVNLQATTTVKNATDWTTSDTVNPEDSDYSSSLTVYDALGQSHIVNVYFRYDGIDDDGNSVWQWAAVCNDCTSPVGGVGNLTFDTNGLLVDGTDHPAGGTPTFVFPGQSSDGQTVAIEFGKRSGGGASTQYQTASTTTFQTQDGYAPGELESISVSNDGTISGHYSNGQILYLYQITLANFNNPNGLRKEGGNLFTETIDSGVAYTNSAGSGALGGISANSLEQSNVDLATEFVNLITCQRGYQANSRVITTTDQMLDELMNLKR
jgi:flagellar hook protein FlgE